MKFSFKDTVRIKNSRIIKEGQRLKTEVKRMQAALKLKYDTDYASINVPGDKKLLKDVQKIIRSKKKLKPEVLVVIGIGGSNLGTIAVHEAVNGEYYNDVTKGIKVYFADTVDGDKVKDISSIIEAKLKKRKNVLVNVVTKSGSTTETIALFEHFTRLVKKYKKKSYSKYFVVTTNRDSRLWKYAEKESISKLEIPVLVGGRYSVFSAVGLFPLGMLGVDLVELQKGAKGMIKTCLKTKIVDNPAAVSAVTTFLHAKYGRNINDTFIYSTDLGFIGKWYRQLMAESIGKEWDKRHRNKVHSGITPTVSIGSTDLHSMAQLYLGGPQDKLTTFVSVKENKSKIKLPRLNQFNELVDGIQGKELSELMEAILEGTKIAFKKGKRPYTEVVLKNKKEKSIAQLLQFKMMEMMYLGYLLGVNPFDQPNVESYKKETRRILSNI